MIATAHLFRPLHQELIALLRGLEPADWQLPTVAGRWTVKDVAAHLLDGMLRRLSAARDGHLPPPGQPLDSPGAFLAFIDGLNADWVESHRPAQPANPGRAARAGRRAGGRLFATLDPEGPAFWPVSWAGEESSPNWLDVGRDYTEQWHHQQQIRLATGRPPLLDQRFGKPALALFALALPFTYREVAAATGTEIAIAIAGEAGGHLTPAPRRNRLVARRRPGHRPGRPPRHPRRRRLAAFHQRPARPGGPGSSAGRR